MVLHHHGNMVAALQAQLAKQLGSLVRCVFKFTARDHLAGLGHDIGWLVGMLLGEYAWVHGLPLMSAGLPEGPGRRRLAETASRHRPPVLNRNNARSWRKTQVGLCRCCSTTATEHQAA